MAIYQRCIYSDEKAQHSASDIITMKLIPSRTCQKNTATPFCNLDLFFLTIIQNRLHNPYQIVTQAVRMPKNVGLSIKSLS